MTTPEDFALEIFCICGDSDDALQKIIECIPDSDCSPSYWAEVIRAAQRISTENHDPFV